MWGCWYAPTEMRFDQIQGFADTQGGTVVLLQLAVFQRFQTVREDVSCQFALVWERGAAVHARIQPGGAAATAAAATGRLRTLHFLQPND